MTKNILILTYWGYSDALIQTYTLPYVRIIKKNLPISSTIFLVTLEKDRNALKESNRLESSKILETQGIRWLPFPYKPFGLLAILLWAKVFPYLGYLIIKNRISYIHSWCTPPGAIAYFLSVCFNRQLVLDSYEPHAEAMVENGTWRKNSIAFRLLFWLEKKQTQRAAYVIATTEEMQDYAKVKYGINLNNFYVKPACVDLDLFSEEKIKNSELLTQLGFVNKIVCVYAGKFGGIYLDKEVFQFLRIAYDYWGEAFRILLLSNIDTTEIKKYCVEAGLPFHVIIKLFVPHAEIPKYIGLADFALCPVKPLPSKRYCTPIKNGEYWALGLPVVIPQGVSDDAAIIEKNQIGAVLNQLTNEAYLIAVKQIEKLILSPEKERIQSIREIARRYRDFEIAEIVYRKIYCQHIEHRIE